MPIIAVKNADKYTSSNNNGLIVPAITSLDDKAIFNIGIIWE